MEKVVKCNGCGLYFMHTEKVTKCPFCKIEYVEVEEKAASSAEASTDAKALADKSAAKKDEKGLQKLKKNLSK